MIKKFLIFTILFAPSFLSANEVNIEGEKDIFRYDDLPDLKDKDLKIDLGLQPDIYREILLEQFDKPDFLESLVAELES